MRSLRIVVASSVAWGSSLSAAPAGDGCTIFSDPAAFEAFNAAAGNVAEPVVDFEAPVSSIGAMAIVPLPLDPLQPGVANVNVDRAGFPAGLATGTLSVQSNQLPPGTPATELGGGLVGIGPAAIAPGIPSSVVVGANVFEHSTDLVIHTTELRVAVGMRVADPILAAAGGTIQLTVFGAGGAALLSSAVPATEAGVFFGVACPQSIARINVAGIGPGGEAGGELVDEIRVWHLACPADLDGDGTVGIADLLAILKAWETSGPADFNGDGTVGIADLLLLLGQWGPCR